MPSTRRRYLAALGSAAGASTLAGCLSGSPPDVTTSWPRRDATNAHTGRVETDGPTSDLHTRWRSSVATMDYPGTSVRSPVVGDGTVYVLDQSPTTGDGARLSAFDAERGQKRWAKRVTDPPQSEAETWDVPDSLVLDGDDLFFRTYAGVHRVTTDGEHRWTFGALGPTGRAATPVVADALVVVGSNDAAVYGLDRASGDVRWRTPTSGGVGHVAAADGVVYAPVRGSDPHLLALDVESGAERWRWDGPGGAGTPSVGDDGLVVPLREGGDDYAMAVLDPETRAVRWREPIAGRWTDSGLALAGGRVHSIGEDGLVARSLADGSVEWRFGGRDERDATVYTTPTVADDTVYVAGYAESSGKVTALDAATGAVRGRVTFRENESVDDNVVAVTDGLLYVTTTRNDVVAVGECETSLFERCLVG